DGRALAAAPEEIALRLLADAVVAAGAPCSAEKPLRLQRLEALWHELRAAITARRAARRTLAQALVTVARDGAVLITPAPPRRSQAPQARAASRGRRKAAKHPFTKPRETGLTCGRFPWQEARRDLHWALVDGFRR